MRRRGEVVRTFRHESLLHRGDEGFLAATLPHLGAAIAAGRPALVAVSAPRIAMLRECLGADGERVRFVDMSELGANPARIIPAWREFLDAHGGQAVLGVSEPVWQGRGAEELRECRLHESLLNRAFGRGPGWHLLCPYDLDALDPDTVALARCTHPHVDEDGVRSRSDRYDPRLATLQLMLSPPAADARAFAFTVDELADVRAVVAGAAGTFGLSRERTQDLVLAASELATNSITHGGGAGTLRLWRDGGELVCQLSDRGRLADPLVGRLRPNERQLTGRGLWIVNQLCDLVQLHSGPDGTTVRVRMRVRHATA